MKTYWVLYDGECGVCRACRDWLSRQEAWVDYRFYPYQKALKERMFGDLSALRPEKELVVISGSGEVWQGAGAWVMCLWGLRRYRWLAERLAGPSRMGWGRRLVTWVSARRRGVCAGGCGLRESTGGGGGGTAGGCVGGMTEEGRFHAALKRARLSQEG